MDMRAAWTMAVCSSVVAFLQVSAQPVDIDLLQTDTLADFVDARSLAVDPAGLLYVVDAGKDAVLLLEPNGYLKAILGGPGTEEGQFDQPADIDPTNGLLWVVADAGNHRLQRFSRNFLHLESMPVARAGSFEAGRATRTVPLGEQVSLHSGDGRPISVGMSRVGETFAIDAAQGHVLKWGASRQFERVIGTYSAGEGSLMHPVALAVAEDQLFVADKGRSAVLVYDLFGTFIRTLAEGRAAEVVNLSVDGTMLWIVLPSRILVYDGNGTFVRTLDVSLEESLVDAVATKAMIYLLTSSQLLQISR